MGLLGLVWRDGDVGVSEWIVGCGIVCVCVACGRGPKARWDIGRKENLVGGTHEASEQALAALASTGT